MEYKVSVTNNKKNSQILVSTMKLSIVIPACNEEESLSNVVEEICARLAKENIENELIIVNDNSTDSTPNIIEELERKYNNIRRVDNPPPPGFGRAVRKGLENITGDAVVIVMGDGSDDPNDVIRYCRKLEEGYDCVFGSRFIKGSVVKNYPLPKLIANRIGNNLMRLLFKIKYNDVSNAFKAYRKKVIQAIGPLVSNHFNLTIEMPLKAITRGFSYAVIPVNWNGRTSGVSKFSLRRVQREYLFSLTHLWLERYFLRKR